MRVQSAHFRPSSFLPSDWENAGTRAVPQCPPLLQHSALVLQGVPSEELSAILCHEPIVEKCAKFWICKAKLLARSGPFDVTGLYEAAVCAGAEVSKELSSVPSCAPVGCPKAQGLDFGISLAVIGEKGQ